MFSNCGDWIDLFLLFSELICLIIFVADGGGYFVCTSSYVASPSIFSVASMNLHSGCSRSVSLPPVWGQVIYVVLVSF